MYTYNGILFSHNKKVNSAICNRMDGPMDLEAIMLSIKVRQGQILNDIINVWNPKKENWYKTE